MATDLREPGGLDQVAVYTQAERLQNGRPIGTIGEHHDHPDDPVVTELADQVEPFPVRQGQIEHDGVWMEAATRVQELLAGGGLVHDVQSGYRGARQAHGPADGRMDVGHDDAAVGRSAVRAYPHRGGRLPRAGHPVREAAARPARHASVTASTLE